MAKSFRTLRDKMAPERRKQNEQRATEMLVEFALQDLRKSLHLTQEQVAEMMEMNQAAISKMERQNYIPCQHASPVRFGARRESLNWLPHFQTKRS